MGVHVDEARAHHLPVASIVSARAAAARSPTAAIRPSATATSARYAAPPVPSITEPPANTFSNAILTSIGSRTDRVIPPSTGYSVR